jgi:pentatricopeptide repeat protein
MSAADLTVFSSARGIQPGGELCGLLLAGVAKKGDHSTVLELLDRMEMQGSAVDGRGWSALIRSCARKKQLAEMGRLVGRVKEFVDRDEVKLTGLDYEEILGAVSGAGLVSEALDLVRLMEGEGFHVGAHVRESVMWAFSKAGQHNQALELYGGESQPSLYLHNLAIRSLCHLGRYADAKDLLRHMMGTTTKPDIISHNTLIGSLCMAQQRNEALAVLREMQEHGCCPTPTTFKALGSG